MFSRDGRRSPYAVLVPFAAVALVSTTTLAWLVREQLRQDSIVLAQQREERFDRAAEAVSESLLRFVADLEALSQLDRDPGALPDGVSIVTVTPTETRVRPVGSLPFLPQPDSRTESLKQAEFAQLELLEFGPRTSEQALAGYMRLAGSRDPVTRASALAGAARLERKAGRYPRALAAYEQLSSLTEVSVDGLPAPLVARVGRLEVLKQAGDITAISQASAALRNDLVRGAWPVTSVQYAFYLREVARDLPTSPGTALDHSDNLARADAVEQFWLKRSALSASGHLVPGGERPVLVAWARADDRWRIAVAGPDSLSRAWQAAAPAGFLTTYATREGRVLSGSGLTETHAPVRNDAADHLPWSIHLASTGAADAGRDSRRLLLLLVFGTVALVTVSGGYFVVRTVRRETRLVQMQSDFVAAVSHEFRSPLTSMYQIAQMLVGGRFPSADGRERSYELLMRETERLRQLVEGLLDFGRLEGGGDFRFERIDVVALVRSTVTDFQERVRADGYAIELSPMPDAVFVRADREALVRALSNLLDNAVKYSPDSRVVWVGLDVPGERCQITVRDQGLGIPADEQPHIFARFVRGAESKARRIRGTGIGLAMVRQIARAHGGDVRLESEPGRGSCFTIELRTSPA